MFNIQYIHDGPHFRTSRREIPVSEFQKFSEANSFHFAKVQSGSFIIIIFPVKL